MLKSTIDLIHCPACQSALELKAGKTQGNDVLSGEVKCRKCKASYPILSGVLVLIEDVGGYLVHHVKGISQCVSDSEIPKKFLSDYLEAKSEMQPEQIEEDLEAERVNALYFMNHYMKAKDVKSPSPSIQDLIDRYWDQGPFYQIQGWMKGQSAKVVELGCGVGGLFSVLQKNLESYLGVDSSFVSISLARHMNLKAPYRKKVRIPDDLLQGSVSTEVQIQPQSSQICDFIVADLENTPLKPGQWDVSIVLNAIDMLNNPDLLPVLQKKLVNTNGQVIQSSPYIWHEAISKKLRKKLPKEIKTSSAAVEWLYKKAGLKITKKIEHQPWLFYKNNRQLELYSVHMFIADSLLAQ